MVIRFKIPKVLKKHINKYKDLTILRYLIAFKSRLDNKIINIEIKINVKSENFCWVLFFKKADRIAIIKSSLLEAIFLIFSHHSRECLLLI